MRCVRCGSGVAVLGWGKVVSRRLLIPVGVLVFILGIVFARQVGYLGTIGMDVASRYLNRESFDSAAWQDSDQVIDEVRIRMVDDLIDEHDFDSMSRDEVVVILGEPDQNDTVLSSQDSELVNWLGRKQGFASADSEWLVFHLDEDAVVTDCGIIRY